MNTLIEQLLAAAAADDETQAEALLRQLRPTDEAQLLNLLEQQDADGRWWFVYALSRCGSAAGIPQLTRLLDDEDAGVRAAAALALAHIQLRMPEAGPESTPAARAAAIAPIGRLLADDEGFVRQTATDALAMCGDLAVPALAAALQGKHEGARTRAMIALRKIATIEAAKIMYPHLNDQNYLVRAYAYEGLDEMGLLENILLKP